MRHYCAAGKEMLGALACSYQHCVLPFFLYQRCVSALFCPALSIRQKCLLAACKTLASTQNISEGYGAKLREARAFPTSLLLTEKPGQFRPATLPLVLYRSLFFVDPDAARQQETQGLP